MLAVAWVLSVAVAFKIGLHLGPIMLEDLDSSAKAALLVHELTALRSGKADAIIRLKEIELDGQVVRAIRCQEDSCGSLLWPVNGAYEADRQLRQVAAYRKTYPPVVVPDTKPRAPGMYDPNPFAQDVQQATTTLLHSYAQ